MKRTFQIKSYVTGIYLLLLLFVCFSGILLFAGVVHAYKRELSFINENVIVGLPTVLMVGLGFYLAEKYGYSILNIELMDEGMKVSWKKDLLLEGQERFIKYEKIEGFRYDDSTHKLWNVLTIKVNDEDTLRINGSNIFNTAVLKEFVHTLENLEWEEKENLRS